MIELLVSNSFLQVISPFIATIFFYLLLLILPYHKWRKIHLTAQWSALFYVYGVIYLVQELFNQFILAYVLIGFILFLAIHVTIQWRKNIAISLKKAIVLLLRIVFLMFFVAHLSLFVYFGIRFFA